MDAFRLVYEKASELERNKASRDVLEDMLVLVTRASDYVCQNTSTSSFGQLLLLYPPARLNCDVLEADLAPGDYREKINSFKKELVAKKDQFFRYVQIEIYQEVTTLC